MTQEKQQYFLVAVNQPGAPDPCMLFICLAIDEGHVRSLMRTFYPDWIRSVAPINSEAVSLLRERNLLVWWSDDYKQIKLRNEAQD